MAETLAPSVRGKQRVIVVGIFLAAGTAVAALVGFGVGIAMSAFHDDSWKAGRWLVAGIVAVVLLLDLVVKTLHVNRQVPVAWGSMFSPRTVAALYGARMGVGPLTILPTWLWWGAAAVGGLCGPWLSGLVGAIFMVSRTATMLWFARSVQDGIRMSEAVQRATLLGDRIWRSLRLALVVLVGAVILSSCTGSSAKLSGTQATNTTTADADAEHSTTTASTTPRHEVKVPDSRLDVSLSNELISTATIAAIVGKASPIAPPQRHTGPIDLEAAALSEADSNAERALLATRGFVFGRASAWDVVARVAGAGTTPATVYVVVYEFSTEANAAAYVVDGRERLLAQKVESFPVATPAGAFGFTQIDETAGAPFVAHAVAFAFGKRSVLVIGGSASGVITSAQTAELARAQVAAMANR